MLGLKKLFKKIGEWYERHYTMNLVTTSILFTWQLVHLYWLTTDVVLFRIFGVTYFPVGRFWQTLLILVDYIEIPALIMTSFFYAYEFSKNFRVKNIVYLVLLNSQWLHLFWITDTFVIHQFWAGAEGTILPVWLAWVAIGIDYLELPVIYDTLKKAGAQIFESA